MNFIRRFWAGDSVAAPEEKLDPNKVKAQLEPMEAQFAEIKQLISTYAISMTAMSAAAVNLASGLTKFYGKFQGRDVTLSQFKHAHKCIDSLCVKMFKEDLKDDVLVHLDKWRAKSEQLKTRTKDYENARVHVANLRTDLTSQQEAKEARIKKGMKIPLSEAQAIQRQEEKTRKYANSLDIMRTNLLNFQAEVMGEGRFKAMDQALFRIMELQMEGLSSMAGLTEDFKPTTQKFRQSQKGEGKSKQTDEEDEMEAEKAQAIRLRTETLKLTRDDFEADEPEVDTMAQLRDEIDKYLDEERVEEDQNRAMFGPGGLAHALQASIPGPGYFSPMASPRGHHMRNKSRGGSESDNSFNAYGLPPGFKLSSLNGVSGPSSSLSSELQLQPKQLEVKGQGLPSINSPSNNANADGSAGQSGQAKPRGLSGGDKNENNSSSANSSNQGRKTTAPGSPVAPIKTLQISLTSADGKVVPEIRQKAGPKAPSGLFE